MGFTPDLMSVSLSNSVKSDYIHLPDLFTFDPIRSISDWGYTIVGNEKGCA